MNKETILAKYLRGILDNEIVDKEKGDAFLTVISYLLKKGQKIDHLNT